MKSLKYILSIAFAALMMTACGGSEYDFERADKIMEKISDNDELSKADYDDAAALCENGFNYLIAGYEEALEVSEKYECRDAIKGFENEDEYGIIRDYTLSFYANLEEANNADELKGEAKNKFKQVEKLYEKWEKLCEKRDKKME